MEPSRRRSKGLIGDTVAELSGWACFNERRPKRSVRKPERGTFRPVRTGEPKVGRNAPCPCGSGKKYKKCCGSRASA